MKILDYCSSYPKQSFDSGECILSEGTQTGIIYVLIDGAVEICKQGVVLTKVSERGAVFGEVSALLNLPHMASVKATEQARFYVINDPQAFLRSNAEIGLIMATVLAQRLSFVTNSLASVKRSVDTLIKQQTSPRKHASVRVPPPVRSFEKPFVGVLQVGPFARGGILPS